MAQAVIRRPVIAGDRVRSQFSPCDICVGLSHTKAGFLVAVGFVQPVTEVCPRSISWCDKGGGCVGVTTLPLSCADYLEI
jgi:hypothetical protein